MEAEEAEDEEDGMIQISLFLLWMKNTFLVWLYIITIYNFNIFSFLETVFTVRNRIFFIKNVYY